MTCDCGCGRDVDRNHFYATPACRDRVQQLLERARVAARHADARPDPKLLALKCTPMERRVVAVLRDAGARGATTAQLVQPEVGGSNGAAQRTYDLRKRGFEIERKQVRRGSTRYWLRSEPTPDTAAPTRPPIPAAPSPRAAALPAEDAPLTRFGPYDDYVEDEAA